MKLGVHDPLFPCKIRILRTLSKMIQIKENKGNYILNIDNLETTLTKEELQVLMVQINQHLYPEKWKDTITTTTKHTDNYDYRKYKY